MLTVATRNTTLLTSYAKRRTILSWGHDQLDMPIANYAITGSICPVLGMAYTAMRAEQRQNKQGTWHYRRKVNYHDVSLSL
jgi:hypothetical protein